MKIMNKNQAMAWAVALKRDKKIGDGVTNTNSVNGFEDGTEEHQNIDDIYEDFNFYMISRLLNEPIWEIDFALYTKESLEASGLTVKELEEDGITPYTPTEFDELVEKYPIGAANGFE
jgi:hypothetical protein